jgi:hypothetical protein
MDLKQAKHWRTQPDIEHRFTYNGFLTCSVCGEVVHTAFARRDYYACRGRRTAHTCDTKYMGRVKLESRLDRLFADQLTSPEFLERCIKELERRQVHDDSAARMQRLVAEVNSLREKRTRVVDAFLDGTIGRDDRNSRLATIDRDVQSTQDLLTRCNPAVLIDLNSLVEAFVPLLEWEYWTREQKRSLLAAMVPDIRLADYQVAELGLDPAIFSNEVTRSRAASSMTNRASAAVPSRWSSATCRKFPGR